MSTDASGSGRPAAERLRELSGLREGGLLSDEEFEAQRARILDESFGLSEAATEPGSGERSAEPPAAGRLESATDLESPGGDVAPPRRSALHPGRWPDWLRIVLTAASGIWIVTIPLMFWRAARFTWLPYLGAATIAVAALLVAVGSEGQELAPSASAPRPAAATAAPQPAATAASPPQDDQTPRRTPEPAGTSATPDDSDAETRSLPVVVATDGGVEIRLETRRQAEIILYYRAVLSYFGPSDHNLGGWRHATTLYQNNRVSTSDYYRYTQSASEAHHYLADKWISEGPGAPDGLREVPSVVSGILQRRGDAMGHVAAGIAAGDDGEVSKSIELLKQATAGVAFVVGKLMFAADESGINTAALLHVVHCDEESQMCGLRPPTSDTPLLLSDCPDGVTDTELSVCKDASSQE